MAKQAEPPPQETDLASFEKNLSELESLVERLERGDLSLEESLRQFERGMRLTEACREALETAEQKVEILVNKDGETATSPFTAGDAQAADT